MAGDIPPHIERYSVPEYGRTHSGSVIVAGTAWTLDADLKRVLGLRPRAPVCGIRRTAERHPCSFIFSMDREALEQPVETHLLRWGPPYYGTHSFSPPGGRTTADYPWIDYFWKRPMGCGSSAWGAAIVLRLMGFEEVILAGCPLEPGPYADGLPAETFDDVRNLTNMRMCIIREKWMHGSVRSCSGWTREFLGEPS